MKNDTLETLDSIKKENPYLVALPFIHLNKFPGNQDWTNLRNIKIPSNCKTYGFNTGLSRLLVIDADKHSEEENGVAKVADYFRSKGYVPGDNTLVVRSANDGAHIYFRLPEGVTTKSGSKNTFLGGGVDIRAGRGCIAGPGSLVKKLDGSIGSYKVASKVLKIADAPSFILEDFTSTTPTKKGASTTRKTTGPKASQQPSYIEAQDLSTPELRSTFCSNKTSNSRIPDYIKVSTLSKVNDLFPRDFKEGKRHDTLNRLSFQLGLVAIPEDKAREALKLDSRAVFKEWDEDPDEVFLSAYIDGLRREFSHDTYLDHRRIWNREHKLSNFSDPVLPEFLSHIGTAEKLADHFSKKFFISKDGTFYEYSKKERLWIEGKPSQLESLVLEYLKEGFIEELVNKYGDEVPFSSLNKIYNLQSRDLSSITSLVVKELTNKSREKSLFEEKKNLFVAKNGIINLEKGRFSKIKPEHLITRKGLISYRPELLEGTPNEIVECLLSCIPESCRDYFLLSLGQAITGNYSDKIVALIGPPSIGKTLLLESVEKVIGPDYSELVSSSIFDSRNTRGFERARLEGKRYVRLEEFTGLSKGSTQDVINSLIDTDTLEGEKKGKDSKRFDNQVSFFYSANKLPSISSSKETGFYRRFLPIICTRGTIYPKGNLKKAFRESKEAQEYLLALIVSYSVKVSKNESLLSSISEEIEKIKEQWVTASQDRLSSKILDLVEVTGSTEDLVFAHDLARVLSKEFSIKEPTVRELGKTFSEGIFQSREVHYQTGTSPRSVDKVSRSIYYYKHDSKRPALVRGMKFKQELELEE